MIYEIITDSLINEKKFECILYAENKNGYFFFG